MKIGIIGSGEVARALGTGFVNYGHEVMLGSRTPEKLADWVTDQEDRAQAGSFDAAAAFGEVIVLATRWTGTADALKAAGQANLSGKVVIDVTNPLTNEPGQSPQLELGHIDSGGEQIQRWLPESLVVKAFNSVGNGLMVDPEFAEGKPTMFIAGDDDSAKRLVEGLCRDFGWEVADMGDITAARLLEPLCLLWVAYGVRSGGWHHALKMLHD